MKPTINNEFIKDYANLITDNVCMFNDVDPSDQRARAILSWNIANPDNKLEVSSSSVNENDYCVTFSNDGEPFEFTLRGDYDGSVEYSMDKVNWKQLDNWEVYKVSDTIYVRGTGNTKMSRDQYRRLGFRLTGSKCEGDLETLLDYKTVMKGEHPFLAEQGFANLFENCKQLVEANVKLPMRLRSDCCAGMFIGCNMLKRGPKLPATKLAAGCYRMMFEYCWSLEEAPELPALELDSACYAHMFEGCISLKKAPKLPATTLYDWCYQYMFHQCRSLVEAPKLPATKMAEGCYQAMFANCHSLVHAPELPAIEFAENCYAGMFEECESLLGIPEGYYKRTADTLCEGGMA